MSDERIKILEMIAQGKISPAEGADLLKALEQDAELSSPKPGVARWLYIRVFEPDTGKVHVNVRFPVSWAEKLMKFTSHFASGEVDFEEIFAAIQSGELGQVVVVDTDEGNRVEVWLEA